MAHASFLRVTAFVELLTKMADFFAIEIDHVLFLCFVTLINFSSAIKINVSSVNMLMKVCIRISGNILCTPKEKT